jgi:hypothetical protein
MEPENKQLEMFPEPAKKKPKIRPLPDDNPKTRYGIKKPSTFAIPASALVHLGMAMENGRDKYGLYNWREKSVAVSVYYDAIMRHLMEYRDGCDFDIESECHPLAHVMACCAILLDADQQKNLIDDRGAHGRVHELIFDLTASNEAKATPDAGV